MGRLIDADELLTHLNACLTNGRPLSNLYDLSEIVSYVESMPTVDAEPRWIPCSERLPKIYEKVLVSTKYTVFTQVFKCIYGFPDRWGWEHNTIKKVTAWMPLPEPYKGEVEQDG